MKSNVLIWCSIIYIPLPLHLPPPPTFYSPANASVLFYEFVPLQCYPSASWNPSTCHSSKLHPSSKPSSEVTCSEIPPDRVYHSLFCATIAPAVFTVTVYYDVCIYMSFSIPKPWTLSTGLCLAPIWNQQLINNRHPETFYWIKWSPCLL